LAAKIIIFLQIFKDGFKYLLSSIGYKMICPWILWLFIYVWKSVHQKCNHEVRSWWNEA